MQLRLILDVVETKKRDDTLEASKLILNNIYNAYTKNDSRSRKNMLYASYLAGWAFSKANSLLCQQRG